MAADDTAVAVVAAELAMHYRNDGFVSPPIGCSCGEEFDGFTTWRRHIAEAVLNALGLRPVAVFRDYPLGSGADWLHEDKERENPLGIEDGTTFYVLDRRDG